MIQQDDRPIHLFFKKNILNYLSDEIRYKIENELERRSVFCESWDDLSTYLNMRPRSICFFNYENEFGDINEILAMIETMSKLVGINYLIPVTIGVRKTTPYKLVKEVQKTTLTGIIPSSSDFGWDETSKGLRAQWAGIPYWPKHILDQLPGRYERVNPTVENIELTPRQNQVYNIISERGVSNKIIGRMLNLSESTVKLHMGAIFKKFGVKNRTQLAVFAKKSNSKKNKQKLTEVGTIP